MGGIFPVRYVRQLAVYCAVTAMNPAPSVYKLIPTNYVSPITGLVESYQDVLPSRGSAMRAAWPFFRYSWL
jgi:hypothetical protein